MVFAAGEWKQKEIDNPAYKGIWEAPLIANPEYVEDKSLYVHKDLKYLGFELWQVKTGTIFDNIMLTDDLQAAKDFAEVSQIRPNTGHKAWPAGQRAQPSACPY